MRNSNVVFRTVAILVLVCSTLFSAVQAQYENPEEVITVSQGYSLRVKHALSVLTYLQSQGTLSQNPSEGEVTAVLEFLVKEFQAAPVATMQEIQAMKSVQQGSTQPPGQTTPAHNPVNPNPSGKQVYTQQDAEREIARIYNSHYPAARIDYTNAQAQQVKAALAGNLLINNTSKTRSSGSGDTYFGMTKASSTNLHFCQNGLVTIQSSTEIAGGGQAGNFSSGGGNGDVLQSWWSVAMVNNQLCLMMADAQGVDALPMFIEQGSVIISDRRYFANPGQAQCQY